MFSYFLTTLYNLGLIQGPEEISAWPYSSIIKPIRQCSDTNISFVGYPNSINQQCTMQCFMVCGSTGLNNV